MHLIRSIALLVFLNTFTFGAAFAAPIVEVRQSFSTDRPVITFESDTTALPTISGVQFLHEGTSGAPRWFDGSAPFVYFGDFFGNQIFGPHRSGNFISGLGIHFDVPVNAIGAWVGAFSTFTPPAGPLVFFNVLIEVFDAQGVSLASTLLPLGEYRLPGERPEFVGFLSDTGISRIEWTVPDGFVFAVDNVVYGNPVDEPGTLALFLIALFALRFLVTRSVPVRQFR